MNVGRPEDWRDVEVLDTCTFTISVGPVKRTPATDEVLIAYAANGQPRAVSAWCPHQRLGLDDYARHGSRPGTIVCAAHGREYDVETGRCLTPVGLEAEGGTLPPLPTWPLVSCADGSWRIDE